MARLVSSIINAARDRHVSFDPQRQPSGPLYRFLAQYTEKLTGKIIAIDPEAAPSVVETFDLDTFDFDAGVVLGANRSIVEVTLLDKPTAPIVKTYNVDVIAAALRFAPNGPRRAAWELNGRFYLRGVTADWQNFESVSVRYTGGLAAEGVNMLRAANMVLPDATELACIEAVALFMAKRGHADPKLPPIDLAAFVATATDAETSYLDTVRAKLVGRSFFTQDVWRP